MKNSILFVAMLIIMGMTSCTATENDPMEQVEDFSSLTSSYGARSVLSSDNICKKLHLEELPGVSAEEACNILSNLKKHNQSVKHSDVKENDHDGICDVDIIMDETISNRYTFTVQLHMEKDSKGTMYYKSFEADCSANTFAWYIKGFSFSTDNATGANKFESPSSIYFKILDEEVRYIQVPVTVKGTYDGKDNKAEFSYTL